MNYTINLSWGIVTALSLGLLFILVGALHAIGVGGISKRLHSPPSSPLLSGSGLLILACYWLIEDQVSAIYAVPLFMLPWFLFASAAVVEKHARHKLSHNKSFKQPDADGTPGGAP